MSISSLTRHSDWTSGENLLVAEAARPALTSEANPLVSEEAPSAAIVAERTDSTASSSIGKLAHSFDQQVSLDPTDALLKELIAGTASVDMLRNRGDVISQLLAKHGFKNMTPECKALCTLVGESVTRLSLVGTEKFSVEAIDWLVQTFPNLQALNLCNTTIAYAAFPLLTRLPLEELNLDGVSTLLSDKENFDDNILKMFSDAKMPLKKVNVAGTYHVTDQGVEYLSHFPLESLILKSCFTITNLGPLSKCTNLSYIDLKHCDRLTDQGMAGLKGLPIRHLEFWSNKLLTDQCLIETVSSFNEIEHLGLGYCEFSDVGIKAVAHPNLRYIELGGCKKITNLSLLYLSQCLKLEFCGLSFCDISDEGIKHLAKLPLTELHLHAQNKITDNGMLQLETVEHLYIRSCKEIKSTWALYHLPLKHLAPDDSGIPWKDAKTFMDMKDIKWYDGVLRRKDSNKWFT